MSGRRNEPVVHDAPPVTFMDVVPRYARSVDGAYGAESVHLLGLSKYGSAEIVGDEAIALGVTTSMPKLRQ